MNGVITRFAPSPTGYLHIGGIRTALVNYILAQQSKSKNNESRFFLRLEDTDKIRSKKEYEKSIINGLNWLGIKWDGEIYSQSKAIKRHKEIAYLLLEKKNAYKCVCSPEELENRRLENIKRNINSKRLCTKCKNNLNIQNSKNNYSIRLHVPSDKNIIINDIIQGKVEVKNKEIDEFILLRKDGTPTYMLSVVVDDYDMGVNTIIRGDDHLNNAFRQIHIYKHLEWEIPNYGHLPLIHGQDGSKLSKRHGAVDINQFKKKGYIPSSLINNLILIGWSPKKDNEFIEINEIIELFDINKLSKSSSIFDYNKLNFFNNHYLKNEDNFKYFEEFINNKSDIKKLYISDKNKILKIFKYYKEKTHNFSELIDIINIYFEKSFISDFNNIQDSNFNIILKDFINFIENHHDWNKEDLEIKVKDFIRQKKIKFSDFGKPLRLILTNNQDGPSIGSILDILGNENTFIRLNNYINMIN